VTHVLHWAGFLAYVYGSVVLGFVCSTRPASAAETVYNDTDARLAIAEAAETYGVSEAWLLAVARCEAPGLNPYAVGRQGELGIAQLHPRGELRRFYALGYANPFNPYEAMDFMAWRFSVGGARAWACS
jgi:hypothetical protein